MSHVRLWRRVGLAGAVSLALAAPAPAQLVPVIARAGIGGVTVDWKEALGAAPDTVGPSFSFFVGGVRVSVSNETATEMGRRDQLPCESQENGWEGSFEPCTRLLWTQSPSTGPLTFGFGTPLLAFGTSIEPDFPGPFVALLTAFAGGELLGSVTATQPNESGTVFIGVRSTRPFDMVRLGLVDAVVDPADFAIDGPVLETVPEPASLLLLAGGLITLGAGLAARRRG